MSGVKVWVCVARDGGLLDDVEVFLTEAEAITCVQEWAGDMEAVLDEDVGGITYFDANNDEWIFDVWPKVIA